MGHRGLPLSGDVIHARVTRKQNVWNNDTSHNVMSINLLNFHFVCIPFDYFNISLELFHSSLISNYENEKGIEMEW